MRNKSVTRLPLPSISIDFLISYLICLLSVVFVQDTHVCFTVVVSTLSIHYLSNSYCSTHTRATTEMSTKKKKKKNTRASYTFTSSPLTFFAFHMSIGISQVKSQLVYFSHMIDSGVC